VTGEVSTVKYLKYLPEVVSFATGVFAWHRIVFVVIPQVGFGSDLSFWVGVFSMGAVLVAAPFYRLMEKPRMRRHFALYMFSFLILAPDMLLFMALYMYFTLIFIIILTAVPVFPICAIYERLFGFRFAETEDQDGGENGAE